MANRWVLVDSDGNKKTITNQSFKRLEALLTVEADVIERTFKAGADFPGIQRDTATELIFQYDKNKVLEDDFRGDINQLMYWLRKTRVIQDTITQLETDVILTEHSIAYDNGGFNRGAINNITFIQLKPYWQDINFNVESETGVSADSFVISNTGWVETPCIITINALENITKYSIRLNETLEGIVVGDLQFGTLGLDTYIIDNENGTLELNGKNRKNKIKSGTGFFNLQVGTNTLIFQLRGTAEIEIKWKRRFYI
jgi:hypothetical protein